MNNECCCDSRPMKVTLRRRIKFWMQTLSRMLWFRYGYRHFMRFIHRFGFHYAPAKLPIEHDPGKREHWCQWCGLRGHTWVLSECNVLFKSELRIGLLPPDPNRMIPIIFRRGE